MKEIERPGVVNSELDPIAWAARRGRRTNEEQKRPHLWGTLIFDTSEKG